MLCEIMVVKYGLSYVLLTKRSNEGIFEYILTKL